MNQRKSRVDAVRCLAGKAKHPLRIRLQADRAHPLAVLDRLRRHRLRMLRGQHRAVGIVQNLGRGGAQQHSPERSRVGRHDDQVEGPPPATSAIMVAASPQSKSLSVSRAGNSGCRKESSPARAASFRSCSTSGKRAHDQLEAGRRQLDHMQQRHPSQEHQSCLPDEGSHRHTGRREIHREQNLLNPHSFRSRIWSVFPAFCHICHWTFLRN
jgi:hypothetical protein